MQNNEMDFEQGLQQQILNERLLKDRVALITGAGQGMGRAMALGLSGAGATVMLNDINEQTCQATLELLQARGADAVMLCTDIAVKAEAERLVQATIARWGRLDILINNAGVETKSTVLEMSEDEWDRVLDVNLKAPFLLSQAAGKIMVKQRYGRIIHTSSIAGKNPLPRAANYCAAKGGLIAFNRELARELAPYNITCNCICPGVIITPMTAESRSNPDQMRKWLEDIPEKRLGEAYEVVSLMLLLASEASAYITGQAINVDGGKVMW